MSKLEIPVNFWPENFWEMVGFEKKTTGENLVFKTKILEKKTWFLKLNVFKKGYCLNIQTNYKF